MGLGQLPDPRWQLVASGYFNWDDHLDHIFQHQGDGRLAVWLMNGHTLVTGFALSPDRVPDLNWKVRGAGHFDGEFGSDLILQNEVTGQVEVWLMAGTTRREVRPLPSVPDTDWRIVGLEDFNRDFHLDILWQNQSKD
jgi:hypothetical protein